MREEFKSYLSYFESLRPDTLEDLRRLATPDLHFVDPFNEVRDIEHVIDIFRKMFKQVQSPSFKILDAIADERRMFTKWSFDFEISFFGGRRRWQIVGVSQILLNDQGLVTDHIDYWDASTQLYMKIPVVGWFIRWLRCLCK